MPKKRLPAAGSGLPENIIPFPLNAGPLDFEAMEIKIDAEEQRQKWLVAYTSVQIALRFCQFDHVQAEDSVRSMIDNNPEIWTELVEYHVKELAFLEGVVGLMREGGDRMQIAYDRVQAKRRA